MALKTILKDNVFYEVYNRVSVYCRLVPKSFFHFVYNEFLSLIAEVKLGAMLGMINISEIERIDDLIVSVRPASLCEQYGKKLSAVDRDLFRAEVMAKKLLKLKE